MTKAIVCGSRSESDSTFVFRILDEMHKLEMFDSVIEGGAQGVDRLAREWSKDRGVPCQTFPAAWYAKGKAAGPIRNREMLNAGASLVIAFPGGPGTLNMKRQARERGVRVIVVDPFGRWA